VKRLTAFPHEQAMDNDELIGGAIFLVLYVGSLVWMFHDARDRGTMGWLVVVLLVLSWPLSLVFWLFYRPEKIDPWSKNQPHAG
jgi:hypothetical protein